MEEKQIFNSMYSYASIFFMETCKFDTFLQVFTHSI